LRWLRRPFLRVVPCQIGVTFSNSSFAHATKYWEKGKRQKWREGRAKMTAEGGGGKTPKLIEPRRMREENVVLSSRKKKPGQTFLLEMYEG
jgi:hypothetical protein